jgi:hypothetical protein
MPMFAVLLLASAVAGCGAPTFDATNEETIKASILRMDSGMTDQQKDQFGKDIGEAALMENRRRTLDGDSGKNQATPKDMSEILKSLHGMTVAQIQAKAEAARQKASDRAEAGKKR